MRRVASGEVAKGVDRLEGAFAETLEDETYRREAGAGVLCDLGENWQMVNVLLTGEDFPATGAEFLPVLGGHHVATTGGPRNVLLVLPPDLVRTTAGFLAGADTDALLARNRSKPRVVGGAPNWMVDQLVARVEAMRSFYREAASAGQAVTKRVYG